MAVRQFSAAGEKQCAVGTTWHFLWLRQNQCGSLQHQLRKTYDLGSAAYAPFDSNEHTHRMKTKMRRQCASSTAIEFNIASHLTKHFPWACNYLFPHIVKTEIKWKIAKMGKKCSSNCLKGSGTMCLYLLTKACWRFVHVYMYVQSMQEAIHVCCQAQNETHCVCLLTHTHTHALSSADYFPGWPPCRKYALSSSLCWAPLPAHCKPAPLKYALISFNKGWYCNSQARRAISQALKVTAVSGVATDALEFVALNLSLVWLKPFLSDVTGEEKWCKYFQVLLTVSVFLLLIFFFRLLHGLASLAVLLNVVKIQLGGHILWEHKTTLHNSNHMNSAYGIFSAPLSLLIRRLHKRQSNWQTDLHTKCFPPLFMATQHNNGYFCNLCCVIQKWKANEMCLLACGGTDSY